MILDGSVVFGSCLDIRVACCRDATSSATMSIPFLFLSLSLSACFFVVRLGCSDNEI